MMAIKIFKRRLEILDNSNQQQLEDGHREEPIEGGASISFFDLVQGLKR